MSSRQKKVAAVKSKHESFVYVRVRPLLPHVDSPNQPSPAKNEEEEGKEDSKEVDDEQIIKTECTILPELTTQTTFKQPVSAINGHLPISGFTGVLGLDDDNSRVFKNALLPRMNTVMKGGTSSLFCYGYTGSGKTHTTLGYGSELGLYHLAVEELLKRVQTYNESIGSTSEPLMLLASVVEVYNDDVFDILGGKAKCTLRKNEKGQLLVRGATKRITFSEEEAKENGADFAIVTSTLSTVHIQSLKDLEYIQSTALSYRHVGASSEHDKSSRSHAVFRLDIVDQPLLDVMDKLEQAQSIKPAIQTAYDKSRTYVLRQKVMKLEKKIEVLQEEIERMYSAHFNKFQHASSSSSPPQEESKGDDPLVLPSSVPSPFGGRLILVDLAGADSDSRNLGEKGFTIEERKESTAINKSLLALKECIRGLQNSSRSIPFRNSSMTRLLEEVLTPVEKRESDSVMIVNVSPAEHLKSKTMNSLRYGAMFSTNVEKAKASSSSRLNSGRSKIRGKDGVRGSRPAGASNALIEAKLRMKKQMRSEI